MTGKPDCSLSIAYSAALVFSASNTVSIISRSTPPLMRLSACSLYMATISSKDILLCPGFEMSSARVRDFGVGPMLPATYIFLPVLAFSASAMPRAITALQ